MRAADRGRAHAVSRFQFDDERRLHQLLEYRTPAELYRRIGSTNVNKCVVKKPPKVV